MDIGLIGSFVPPHLPPQPTSRYSGMSLNSLIPVLSLDSFQLFTASNSVLFSIHSILGEIKSESQDLSK